jgi:hypothetical protein
MPELIVKRQYCEEHSETDHYIDENYHCHGRSLAEIQKKGYSYARHIGGGWFRLIEKYRPMSQQDLAWEMAAEAHDSIHAPYYEPEF